MTGVTPSGSGCQPTASAAISGASSRSGIPNANARFVAPWTPSERMWGGLARSIMMAMSFSGPLTPRGLLQHLKCTGAEIPQWLLDEPEMKSQDHALSKGTRCVIIYRAMLWDGRSEHLTPSGHAPDCGSTASNTRTNALVASVGFPRQ